MEIREKQSRGYPHKIYSILDMIAKPWLINWVCVDKKATHILPCGRELSMILLSQDENESQVEPAEVKPQQNDKINSVFFLVWGDTKAAVF